MRKKRLMLLAAMMTVLVAFTGCTSGGGNTSAQGSTASGITEEKTTASGTTEETTAVETVVFRCGVKQSHAPYSYLDDKGNLVGLDEDVVTEVFNRLDGYEVEFVGFDASPALFSALQAGSIDFASGQYVANAERRTLYKFPTQCYNLAPMYLASREGDHFQTLEDIAGETLEFVSTSFQKETIQAYNKTHPGKEINIVDVSDSTAADRLQQIVTGQRNVELLFKGSFDTVQNELNLPGLVLSDKPVIVNDVYQVFRQDVDDEFIELFDQVLKEMLEDGTLGRISEKWTGEDVISIYNDLVIPIE